MDDSFARLFVKVLERNAMPNLLSFSLAFTKLSVRGVELILDYVKLNQFTRVQEIDLSGLCLGDTTRHAMRAMAANVFSGIISF